MHAEDCSSRGHGLAMYEDGVGQPRIGGRGRCGWTGAGKESGMFTLMYVVRATGAACEAVVPLL